MLYWHRRSNFHCRNDSPPAANWQSAIFPRESTPISSHSWDPHIPGTEQDSDFSRYILTVRSKALNVYPRHLSVSLVTSEGCAVVKPVLIFKHVFKLFTMMLLSISKLVLRRPERYPWLLLQIFRLLSDCWQQQQRLINEQWQERWLPARERLSWDLDPPEAKDKGGKGKTVTTQLKLSPPLCLDNLHEWRRLWDHFAWISVMQLFIIFHAMITQLVIKHQR